MASGQHERCHKVTRSEPLTGEDSGMRIHAPGPWQDKAPTSAREHPSEEEANGSSAHSAQATTQDARPRPPPSLPHPSTALPPPSLSPTHAHLRGARPRQRHGPKRDVVVGVGRPEGHAVGYEAAVRQHHRGVGAVPGHRHRRRKELRGGHCGTACGQTHSTGGPKSRMQPRSNGSGSSGAAAASAHTPKPHARPVTHRCAAPPPPPSPAPRCPAG